MNKARIAVLAAFFINGSLFGTWASRIPEINTKLSLSEEMFGLVLLGFSVGTIIALSMAGGLVARFGSYQVTLVGNLALFVMLPLLALAATPGMLTAILFFYGVAMSLMDVAMNSQAVDVQNLGKKPIMSSFHASFSAGGIFAPLIGAGMIGLSVAPLYHFLLAVGVFAGLAALTYPRLIKDKEVDAIPERGSVFQFPARVLWLLGLIAFCSSVGEGAMWDWGAIYLEGVLETSASFAALGLTAFSVTMTLGRIGGDWLAARVDPVTIVRWGGGLATAGLIFAAWTTSPVLVLAGFAAVGLGLANIIPLAFTAAGNIRSLPAGAGIAGVATIGYAGFLAGPPIIGVIAEGTSLRMSLLFVAILSATLVFTAKSVRVAD